MACGLTGRDACATVAIFIWFGAADVCHGFGGGFPVAAFDLVGVIRESE